MSEHGIYGFAGRVLFADLDSGSHRTEALNREWCEESLGGFGMNLRLYESLAQPGCDPLSADSRLILGAGPLVGTLAPGASRVMATARFPLTGAVASACGGMGLGAQIKWAGYDHLVIRGRATQPSYLLVEDRGVRVIAAPELWGRDTHETTAELWSRHPGSSVACIGQAGENQVCSALAIIDMSSTLGRGGLGAVMGAKLLKAIVVRGSGGVAVADPDRFMQAVDGLHRRLRSWPRRERALQLGMMASYPGLEPAYLSVKRGRAACPSCFVGDKDVLGLPGEPPSSFTTSCTSYLNAMLLGLLLDLDLREQVLILDLLDRLGLCLITFMNMALFLRDLAAHGLLQPGDLELPDMSGAQALDGFRFLANLAWGIALKQGAGTVLAAGWRAALAHFGPEAERFAITVKGQDCLYDPRVSGLGTMEFEQVVSPRGPTSASSGSPTYSPGTPLPDFPRHAARMGATPEAVERICAGGDLNVGRLTRYSEDWFSLFGSLGICNRAQNNRFYNIEVISELFSTGTGMQAGPRDLMDRAAASWELYRALNRREGFSEADDRAPAQWFREDEVWRRAGRMEDYFHRRAVTAAEMDRLLEDYRDERSR